MRTYFILFLFIIFALASYWLLEDINEEQQADKQTEEHFPDYFMENFSITNMNVQGKPDYIINAKKMLHFGDNDSSELERPHLSLFQKNIEITLIADRAIYFEKQDSLYLYDNITLHRAQTATQSELSIYTDYLKIDSKTQIAETDRATRVVTNDAVINSIGFYFDNIKGTLILKSQVKGVYEPAN